MFENRKTILFITRSKITVSDVTVSNNPTEKIIGQFDWTPYTLDNVLLRIKRIISDHIRILLSEDFVYVVNVSLPPNIIVNKDVVRQKAQPLIPENLRETVWDFKEIVSLLLYPNKQPMITIQVVAVVKTFFETLSKSITNVDLRIEAIEPLSYALARFTKKQNQSFLFVYIDEETLLALAQKEVVLATERLSNVNVNTVNQFIAFAKEKFLIEPKSIVFCGNTKNIDLKQYENPSLKAEIQNISPAISLAYKEDIKGKDEDVLNLELLKILHTEKQNISLPTNVPNNLPNKISTQKTHFSYTPIVGIGFVLTIGAALGFIAYKNISSKKPESLKLDQSTTSKPAPTPTSTSLATESSEIDKSAYTISILNGSGISGEATKLETLLKDEGFNVVKTGNAERFDYGKTEVRFKEKVSSEFILILDKLLKTLYDFSIGAKLEEEYDSDILIITGKSIKE